MVCGIVRLVLTGYRVLAKELKRPVYALVCGKFKDHYTRADDDIRMPATMARAHIVKSTITSQWQRTRSIS